MWMGLLWFFNFVQTPAYAEMDAAARNNAFDKLTWRALWWFRWAADGDRRVRPAHHRDRGEATSYNERLLEVDSAGVDAARSASCSALTMLYNVWMVIWPTQQIVIANARNVQAGGEAEPDRARPRPAPARWHRGRTRSSRCRCWSSWSAPSHFYDVGPSFAGRLSGGQVRRSTCSSAIVVLAVLELNALGKISGRGNTGLNVIYETHKNAMYTGFAPDRRLLHPRRDPAPRLSARTSAQTPSRSAMRARCHALGAEQRLARLDALHVEVHVVLPRVADAAVDLDAFLGEQALAVAGRGLRHRRRARAPRVVLGDRERREVAGRPGPFERRRSCRRTCA